MGAAGSGVGQVMCWLPLPAAPIGVERRTTASGSCDQLNLRMLQRMVCRSLGANPDDLKDPIKISIPRYVLCGQGKDEHYEFEIKITVLDETWTVFRRYSRFREMHKTLKLKYPEIQGFGSVVTYANW
ncbi:Kinesin-like protein KIF16B [Chelonia mydas]|uniref:Kinesin-like protein KIF16B n=1 Tax=Chelonia mydas TaxID=8469 RepID=M7B018_CHEMY|nr:Kinesin-like protein KIF16B [Chelonia mydas]